jgi:hypothetical protein
LSKGGATTIVLVMWGVLSVLALTSSKGATDGSTYKRLWGSAVAATGLAVAADFVPSIVGPLALAVLIAAVAKNPGWFGNATGGQLGSPTTATTTTKK